MLIKVRLKNDVIVTRINGTLEEIARYYFSGVFGEVEEIEILEGGELNETEYMKMTATLIYRVEPEKVKEFDLQYNIRYCLKVEYKPEYKPEYEDYRASAGLVNIA